MQPPNPNADSSLSFEEGEVLYENQNLLEWAKFFKGSMLMAYLSVGYFVPLNYLFFSHTPLELATSRSALQPHDVSFYYFDKFGFHIPMMAGLAYYSSYYLLRLSQDVMRDYVVKMQYSKDKELLFVQRISWFGQVDEEVHEMHHVEMLPPCTKAGLASHSAQDHDGLYEIYNMNGMRSLVCYKQDHFWNPALKNDFLRNVTGMWGKDAVTPTRQEKNQLYNDKVRWAMGFANDKKWKQIA